MSPLDHTSAYVNDMISAETGQEKGQPCDQGVGTLSQPSLHGSSIMWPMITSIAST